MGDDAESRKEDHVLLSYVRENIIGAQATFVGPFGKRKVIYCDTTASGKPLKFIEDYISTYVLPLYGNTHTTTAITSLQTGKFRNEAREIVGRCTNCIEDDVVIFTGSGMTGAIHKLMHVMDMYKHGPNSVIFTSPAEHYSNILPWRECGARIVHIKETLEGQVDLQDLEKKLKKHQNKGEQLIGSFTAASNLTGILIDTESVARLLHRYGAMSFWDFAAAAPYAKIDMNPSHDSYKDAIFFSPHKFAGGPSTTGVLIAKKRVFKNPVPGHQGGGTISFVTRDDHEYLNNIIDKEEGGTPALVDAIRVGLVMQVKEGIGCGIIQERENEICRKVFTAWKKNPNIMILGSHESVRIPIFCVLIRHPASSRYLHYYFVSMLMNDLFGLQVRGGVSCAGPYANDLLGLDTETSKKYSWFLSQYTKKNGNTGTMEIMKPGFTRISIPYYLDDETVDFIIQAVDMVATQGWKLLPLYTFNQFTGQWQHRHHPVPVLNSLYGLHFHDDHISMTTSSEIQGQDTGFKKSLAIIQEEAVNVFDNALSLYKEGDFTDDEITLSDEDNEKYLWFILPHEALDYLKESTNVPKTPPPFSPKISPFFSGTETKSL